MVDDPIASDEAADATLVRCWRCDLDAPATSARCAHCGAPLDSVDSRDERRARTSADPVKTLICTFVLLLSTGVVHAFVLDAMVGDALVIGDSLRTNILLEMLVVEAIDSVIIVAAFLSCARGDWRLPTAPARRQFAWLVAGPLFALLLAVNFLYHWGLRELLQTSLIEDELAANVDLPLLVVYCVQPALVEEAYCRGFALGVIRKVAGANAAVWISAVMFGLLHVASPLSIPYLTLFGACMGYVRLASGSLLLPVLLHFAHNLAVLWIP